MNTDGLQARLLDLHKKAQRRVTCPKCGGTCYIEQGSGMGFGARLCALCNPDPRKRDISPTRGTILDPSLAWLRGVLDGQEASEGTGRIGAKPAIEGLLVECDTCPAQYPGRYWSRDSLVHVIDEPDDTCPTCDGGVYLLHPLVRQLADDGRNEAIVGWLKPNFEAMHDAIAENVSTRVALMIAGAFRDYDLEALLEALEETR